MSTTSTSVKRARPVSDTKLKSKTNLNSEDSPPYKKLNPQSNSNLDPKMLPRAKIIKLPKVQFRQDACALEILQESKSRQSLTQIYDYPPFLDKKVDDLRTVYNLFSQQISSTLAQVAAIQISKLTEAKAQESEDSINNWIGSEEWDKGMTEFKTNSFFLINHVRQGDDSEPLGIGREALDAASLSFTEICKQPDSAFKEGIKARTDKIPTLIKMSIFNDAKIAVQHGFRIEARIDELDSFGRDLAIHSLSKRIEKLEVEVKVTTNTQHHIRKDLNAVRRDIATDKIEKAERVLKLLGVEHITDLRTYDEVRFKVAEYIKCHLGPTMHSFKTISIIPVIPQGTRTKPYAILKFLDVNDARHFEGAFSRYKRDSTTHRTRDDSKIFTVRWAISGSELTGSSDELADIQGIIADDYNERMTAAGKGKFRLKDYHTTMIRITPARRFSKGKTQFVLEFIDPCDQVGQLHYYSDSSPFMNHDFSQDFPNPNTRKLAGEFSHLYNDTYKNHTVENAGLWKRKEYRNRTNP